MDFVTLNIQVSTAMCAVLMYHLFWWGCLCHKLSRTATASCPRSSGKLWTQAFSLRGRFRHPDLIYQSLDITWVSFSSWKMFCFSTSRSLTNSCFWTRPKIICLIWFHWQLILLINSTFSSILDTLLPDMWNQLLTRTCLTTSSRLKELENHQIVPQFKEIYWHLLLLKGCKSHLGLSYTHLVYHKKKIPHSNIQSTTDAFVIQH